MAMERVREPISLTISAAVAQYRFLEMGAGVVAQASAAGDDIVGVSLETRSASDFTAGRTRIPVALPGCKVFVEAGAAVTLGSAVTSDSVGRCIDVAAATDRIAGYALSAATAAGQLVGVLFLKAGDRRDA